MRAVDGAPVFTFVVAPPKEWRTQSIGPIPCQHAKVVVTIGGEALRGFLHARLRGRRGANVGGEVNGCGVVLGASERQHAGWPAVRGLALAVVER